MSYEVKLMPRGRMPRKCFFFPDPHPIPDERGAFIADSAFPETAIPRVNSMAKLGLNLATAR